MPNLIINNYCNQKCSYCFAEDSMTIKKNDMNTQSVHMFLKVLRFLKKYNYAEIRLLGGEPLLHPRITDFLQLGVKGGFNIILFSNVNFEPVFIRTIFNGLNTSGIRVNCNINNKDFYTQQEHKNLSINLAYLVKQGYELIAGYNIYDLEKSFEDIAMIAKDSGIKRVNLKATNTIAGKDLIIDTGTREYGKYIFDIVLKYHKTFLFDFSCGLDKKIFLKKELDFFEKNGINICYGCSGFVGGYDIDIDGSIYKCFPTRDLYLNKNLNILNYNPLKHKISSFGIPESDGICSAHKI